MNILLLHISLLALTHRQNYRERNEYTRCTWAGGNFFPVVLLYQFLVLAGNRFWFLHTYVLRVQYSCGVVLVFWFSWEIVLVLRAYLVYNTVVRLRQFFGCGGILFSKWEHTFIKKSYWVTSLWSDSWCVFFIRPNTLLLCIFLCCIFLLCHADPQVEIQIRILLKDKYRKLCQ